MTSYPNWFNITGKNFFKQCNFPENAKMLQIGAFTGDASVWLMENTTGTLTDVDTWAGSEEEVHAAFDWPDVEATYDRKMAAYADRLTKRKMTSNAFFEKNYEQFDFVYVDGDHEARSVLSDGLNAFDCLKVGGVIAFDDLSWQSGKGPYYDPEMGIRGFYEIHKQFLEILAAGSQLWVQKTSSP